MLTSYVAPTERVTFFHSQNIKFRQRQRLSRREFPIETIQPQRSQTMKNIIFGIVS